MNECKRKSDCSGFICWRRWEAATIGRYGRIRWEYLKNHRRGEYIRLLMDGKLNEYLHEVDEECHERIELLVEEMKAGAGITEELKASNQMKWVGLMNNVRSAAEEIVIRELIYV